MSDRITICYYADDYIVAADPRCSSHQDRVAVGDASHVRGRRIARGIGSPDIRAFEHEVVRRVCVECMERAKNRQLAAGGGVRD